MKCLVVLRYVGHAYHTYLFKNNFFFSNIKILKYYPQYQMVHKCKGIHGKENSDIICSECYYLMHCHIFYPRWRSDNEDTLCIRVATLKNKFQIRKKNRNEAMSKM